MSSVSTHLSYFLLLVLSTLVRAHIYHEPVLQRPDFFQVK